MEPQIITPAPNKKSFLWRLSPRAVFIISIVSLAIAVLYTGAGLFETYDVGQRLDSSIKSGFVENFVEYQTPSWAGSVSLVGHVTGIPLLLTYALSVGDEGSSLMIGIFLEFFDVAIVFLFWFFLLYVLA